MWVLKKESSSWSIDLAVKKKVHGLMGWIHAAPGSRWGIDTL